MTFSDYFDNLDFPSKEYLKEKFSSPPLHNLYLSDINCDYINLPSSTIFPHEGAIQFKYWLKQDQDRLDNIKLTYAFLMYYFDKRNYGGFKSVNGDLYRSMFYYYVNFIYYQIFSMFDNIYHLLNIYYQMEIDPPFIEKNVMEQLKIKNKNLYTYLKDLKIYDGYEKGSDIRNFFTHGYLPSNIKSGILMKTYYSITDETIKKFKEKNTKRIITEKTLEKIATFLSNDENVIIKRIKDTPYIKKCLQEFLEKLKFDKKTITLIIENSEAKKTTTINRKVKILECMKLKCMQELYTIDEDGLTSFNDNFIDINDPKFKCFTKQEKQEILENSKPKIKSVSGGNGDYMEPKEFKDNIDQLIDLLSKTLIEFKAKLNLPKDLEVVKTSVTHGVSRRV